LGVKYRYFSAYRFITSFTLLLPFAYHLFHALAEYQP
jgi:hypothetical protein